MEFNNMKESNIKTYCVRLRGTGESLRCLHETMLVHDVAFNIVSKGIFEHLDKPMSHPAVHKRTYKECKKIPGIKSQIAIKARMAAIASYRAIRENGGKKWRETVTAPALKVNPSIRLDSRLYRILPENRIKISVVGHTTAEFSYSVYPKLAEMIGSGEMLDPLVYEKGGEAWLAISFGFPDVPVAPITSCLGVDLGERRFAVTSEGTIYRDKTYLARRRNVRYGKKMLQPHGRKSSSALRKRKSMQRREANLSKDLCHRVANDILQTSSDVIVLEDLSGLKTDTKCQGRRHNSRLSQLPAFQFRTILGYKARTLGKRVETVEPAYTSQDDSRGLPRGRRAKCRYYATDGVVLDADHNAAVNIAARWGNRYHRSISSSAPLRGRQTLWTGRRQPANRVAAQAAVTQAVGFSRR